MLEVREPLAMPPEQLAPEDRRRGFGYHHLRPQWWEGLGATEVVVSENAGR